MTFSRQQILVWGAAALISVALVAALATGGVLMASGVWSPLATPTVASRNSAPSYPAPAYTAPQPVNSTSPIRDLVQQQQQDREREKQARCASEMREYQQAYTEYQIRKAKDGVLAGAAPSKPIFC